MSKAKEGDKVKVHYKGTLTDGSVFDSSEGREPLEFTVGSGQVIVGFEKGVEGMEVNEKKSLNIPAVDAYGERNDELMIQYPKTELPDDINPEVGQQLQMQNQDGQTFVVTVAEVSPEAVTLDGNHPMAGKDLNFDLELVEIG